MKAFNFFLSGATKDLLGLEGSEALMQTLEKDESKIVTVKDEKTFFSLIEERLERQGYVLLDTFDQSSQQAELAGLI